MPPRNLTLADAGKQGLYSAQFKPQRLYANGLPKRGELLADSDDSDEWDGSIDNGYATIGYGVTTQGEYTVSKGMWKTFGSVGQGTRR